MDTKIEIGTLLSSLTQEGMVELKLNAERAQMDLAKAREVYQMLGAAIEAAVSDQVVWQFFTKNLGTDPDRAARIMLEFRKLRQGSYSTVFAS